MGFEPLWRSAYAQPGLYSSMEAYPFLQVDVSVKYVLDTMEPARVMIYRSLSGDEWPIRRELWGGDGGRIGGAVALYEVMVSYRKWLSDKHLSRLAGGATTWLVTGTGPVNRDAIGVERVGHAGSVPEASGAPYGVDGILNGVRRLVDGFIVRYQRVNNPAGVEECVKIAGRHRFRPEAEAEK